MMAAEVSRQERDKLDGETYYGRNLENFITEFGNTDLGRTLLDAWQDDVYKFETALASEDFENTDFGKLMHGHGGIGRGVNVPLSKSELEADETFCTFNNPKVVAAAVKMLEEAKPLGKEAVKAAREQIKATYESFERRVRSGYFYKQNKSGPKGVNLSYLNRRRFAETDHPVGYLRLLENVVEAFHMPPEGTEPILANVAAKVENTARTE